MFKIRGADQKEYGPVSAEVMRQWIAEGRVTAQTPVQAEGSSEWKPLSGCPEFQSLPLAGRPAGTPGLPAAQPPGKTSGLAISSLVLGVLGCFGITALVGLVLGIVALAKINRSQGRLGGKGLAIAGICVSGAMLFFSMAGLILPAVAKAKSKAATINCVHHVKQLTLAVHMWSNDNNHTFPTAANWCDAILPTAGSAEVLQCPSDTTGQRCSYAFNTKLSGLSLDKVDPQTVMIFESKGGWNVSGGSNDMVSHHFGTYVVGFADGSVQQVPASRLSQLRWEP